MKTLDLLQQLMNFKPVTADVDNVNNAVQYVTDILENAGLTTAQHELNGRKILYASTESGKQADIILNAHLDVVPADNSMFTITHKDNQLYGRGVGDCLGNSAVIVQSLLQLKKKTSVGVIFSTDEETGGSTTKHMVEQGYRARKLYIVIDGDGYALTVAQKGILALNLKAEGKGCHAAYPWQGQNAFDKLVEAYLKIRDLFPAATADNQWVNTMAPVVCKAGEVYNRVPDQAELGLNIRYINPGDRKNILKKIRDLSSLDVEILMESDPVFFDETLPAMKSLRHCMQRILDREIPIQKLNGATDARHFAISEVPVAVIGMPSEDLHGNNENIPACALDEYRDLLLEFLPTL